jgi:hypothetical protein
LDPIDAEAVAAGADPVFSADAAVHARECHSCQALVSAARTLSEALEGLSGAPEAISGLADRVTRLRPFSRRERRTYALWKAPVLLTAGAAASGLVLLVQPTIAASDQVSVGAAALAPILALLRSTARWAVDLVALAPTGLQALSQGLRQDGRIGLAALTLLLPLAFGLRTVLSRASLRR